jgi:hypothetical protein
MISRLWHGYCPNKNGDRFEDFLLNEVSSFNGCVASYTKRIDIGENSHFYVCTFWPTAAALSSFAGSDPATPVNDPTDRLYEVVSDPIVMHFPVETIADPFTPFFLSRAR